MNDAGTRFMAAFNDIEEQVRRSLGAKEHADFVALANQYAKKKHLTRDQLDALRVFASLRNAITHGRYFDGRPIANPVPEVVEAIERLRDLLGQPPKALNAVLGQQVKAVRPDDALEVALSFVREFDYSQLPVYDEAYVGLLTTNAIARWLAAQFGSNSGLAETAPVDRVLEFAEDRDRGFLASRALTAAEAIDLLERGSKEAGSLAAVIITDSGKAHERPLAVVVRDDLPTLYDAVATRF